MLSDKPSDNSSALDLRGSVFSIACRPDGFFACVFSGSGRLHRGTSVAVLIL